MSFAGSSIGGGCENISSEICSINLCTTSSIESNSMVEVNEKSSIDVVTSDSFASPGALWVKLSDMVSPTFVVGSSCSVI